MKIIKCQSCGNIFENETDDYQLCPDCYVDYLFYDRAADELRREIKKNTGCYSDIKGLYELKEKYSKAASRYRGRLYKNKYLINSTYKCRKCNAEYESHYDTIFCDKCRDDWNKLCKEFKHLEGDSLEEYAEYIELYDKYNRERLGL